jgi:hypothetical protein
MLAIYISRGHHYDLKGSSDNSDAKVVKLQAGKLRDEISIPVSEMVPFSRVASLCIQRIFLWNRKWEFLS